MIGASLSGAAAVERRFAALPAAIERSVAQALLRLSADLQRDIQLGRLSGQVLKARSGALRASIAVAFEQEGGRVAVTIGSDLSYAAIQEQGFAGTQSVAAHLRRIRQVFGRPVAEHDIAVGGYVRRVELPARSFLRSALEDAAPETRAAIAAAVSAAVAA